MTGIGDSISPIRVEMVTLNESAIIQTSDLFSHIYTIALNLLLDKYHSYAFFASSQVGFYKTYILLNAFFSR